MTTLTPLLCATPGTPSTYNPAMAHTFSWIPIENEIRPLYAQAMYLTNPDDINVTLNTNANVVVDHSGIESRLDKTNASLTNLIAAILGFAPPVDSYDAVVLDPPTKPTTVTYKTGGLAGTNVAVLTVTYSGEFVQSIVKS